ncbi:MAG: imidazole glycerol phosphate synthase subunit HisH [Ktedonobacteraceae bacterium]
MIAIIDYGAGNMHSIVKALQYVGAEVRVADSSAGVEAAQAVVLPGVGAGGAAMARMKERGLDEAIWRATQQGKPFLGICLGMQLLVDHHEEGAVNGLGLFRGEVRLIPHGPKIPHMGWNSVTPLNEDLAIFADVPANAYFYFAHSYYVEPQNQEGVATVTDYGSPYCSVIVTEQVWGTQFHPEKRGTVGLQLLSNFVKWTKE